MSYSLEIAEDLDRQFQKLQKKDRVTYESLAKKIDLVIENPLHFKPLRAPLQNKRRVHVGPFVLIFTVDESNKIVRLLEFENHDKAYLK